MIISISEYQKYPQVKGVFVGGCVARGEGSRFHAKAHTHTKKNDKYKGWICFLSEKRTMDKMLVLHELAHAITKEGHTDKWRDTLLQIGGTLDVVLEANGKGVLLKSYHKRSRKVVK